MLFDHLLMRFGQIQIFKLILIISYPLPYSFYGNDREKKESRSGMGNDLSSYKDKQ
jgi:hypothetical protein